MRFQNTVSKKNITDFVEGHGGEKSEMIQKIQRLKDNTVQRLARNFSGKFMDPLLVKGVENDYFDVLKTVQGNIDPHFAPDDTRKELESMFKKEIFENDYIAKFKNGVYNKYLETSKNTLLNRKNELSIKKILQQRDADEIADINQVLYLLDTRNIKNTKSRTVLFDKTHFHTSGDKFNVECFFEEDNAGNRNYFSLNELLNDLETFGMEFGYPVLNLESLGSYEKNFVNVQKYIKLALVKNVLAKYRDYQEILMYNFVDYEKQEVSHNQRIGIMAEKVVERSFRNFANLEDKYVVNVSKASVGEDQNNKVDLIVQLKDKKTGVNIKKELQLTIDHNKDVLMNKRTQIARQKQYRGADLDLLELEMNLLGQKITLWKNLNRPVGGLHSLLSIEDRDFLRTTFDKIVSELEHKKQE